MTSVSDAAAGAMLRIAEVTGSTLPSIGSYDWEPILAGTVKSLVSWGLEVSKSPGARRAEGLWTGTNTTRHQPT